MLLGKAAVKRKKKKIHPPHKFLWKNNAETSIRALMSASYDCTR
jgi:hypothetical protein